MNESVVVFASYKPNSGKENELLVLVKKHFPVLQEYGLVTKREPIQVISKNGTIIEVFEWVSKEASSKAHEHPAIAKIWEAMAKVCNFESVDSLEEVKKPFAHFKALN